MRALEAQRPVEALRVGAPPVGGQLGHPAAAFAVLMLALVTYGTGRYFSWGHILERAYQLKMAEEQLEKECVAAGLPVPPRTPMIEQGRRTA